jgi:hypothetical protein
VGDLAGFSLFEDVVARHSGTEFVNRRWLEDKIESVLDNDACRYVLLTAEPGAGKTCLVAALAQRRPLWLRYFARRDSQAPLISGDIRSFLLEIGHQLASIRPELFQPDGLEIEVKQRVEAVLTGGRAVGLRIEDLTASPFFPTAVLRAEQFASRVEGTLVGIEIEHANVEPRLLEPDNLVHLALIAPAAALAVREPTARIVILVDALDEFADYKGNDGLLAWLASGPELPANVRLILTSRPHDGLELFRQRRGSQLTELGIDPDSPQVRGDLVTYAGRKVRTDAVARALASGDVAPGGLAEAVATHAQGNFAYVVAYFRALVDAIERSDDDLRDRLLRFSDVPSGLEPLYALFMASIRADISRLGMLDLREPSSWAEARCPAWESVGQPILGILTVAREPLTLDQIARLSRVRVWRRDVANVLARLRQFLDTTPNGTQLFHSSLAEFLLSDRAKSQHPDWAVEEQEWHQCIVICYRDGAPSWDRVDWPSMDRYGLRNLAAHLARCPPRLADELVDLVNPGLRQALRGAVGSDREFLAIIERAAYRAVHNFSARRALPAALFLGIVARQVASPGRRVSPRVVGLLARLGRIDEALDYVHLLPPSGQQCEGLREVLRHADAEQLDERRKRELIELLVRRALAVPPERAWSGTSLEERCEAVEAAAIELAPYDLARALRLAALARGMVSERFWKDRLPVEDAVYRAAAHAAPPADASEIVARMSVGRASAYLDLVEGGKFDGAPPAELLARAEKDLPTERPSSRLVCRARLAAQWLVIDIRMGYRLVDSVLREVIGPTPEDPPGERHRWDPARVQAAERLASADAVVARALLGQFDETLVGRPLLAAAKLWTRLGDTDRCRRLLADFVEDTVRDRRSSGGELAEAAVIVAPFDPTRARELVEHAIGHLEAAMRDTQDWFDGLLRYDDLAYAARVLTLLDRDRALTAAGKIRRQEWARGPGTDRLTALADMAHAHLDAGQLDWAIHLLTICLTEVNRPLPIESSEIPPHVPMRLATEAGTPASLRAAMMGMGYTSNAHSDWQSRCRWRLFFEPADVVRALTPPTRTVGTPGWDRALRSLAEATGRRRIEVGERLLGRVGAPEERAIGLAGLGECARSTGDPHTVRRLLNAAVSTLRECPRFEWTFDHAAAVDEFNRHKQNVYTAPGFSSHDLDKDTEDTLAYLLPDQRTRFEVAIRGLGAGAGDSTGIESAFLLRAYRSTELCAVSRRMLDEVNQGSPWPAEAIAFHHEHAQARGQSDDPLTRVTQTRLVAAERVLRYRGAHDRHGTHRSVPPTPPLAVTDPVYAGVADLLSVRAGLPVADRLVRLVRDLLATNRRTEVVHLASLTALALVHTDTDAARTLAADAAVAIDAIEDPFSQALARARLAEPAELAGLIDIDALLDTAIAQLDGELGYNEHEELQATLFPVMVTARPAAAAELLWTTLRTDWREAMALLEWAAEALVDSYGIDIAEEFHSAYERAQNFYR